MRRTVLYLACLVSPAAAGPPEVAVVRPVERELADHVEATGRTAASQSVAVRARVSGYIDKLPFETGDAVKKGDVLVQLDDRPLRAELDKAQATLAAAEAQLRVAEIEHKRTTNLAASKVVSKEEVEKSAAAVEAARAGVRAAQAGVESAKLNLGYARITSPIDGVISQRSADVGNLARADADTVVTVIARDPVYVWFDLDERTVLQLARRMRDAKDRKLPVEVRADADDAKHDGALDLLDAAVDAATGTVRARAVLPNPKGELRPGAFVRGRIALGPPRKVLLVPADCLVRDLDGRTAVWVATDKNVLAERPVKIGPTVDGLRAIEEGLKADEWVVRDPRGPKAGDAVTPKREKAPPPKKPAEPGAAAPRPAPEFPAPGPAVVITATCPGADARTVEDTVAAPIHKQLDGLDGMRSRVAVCTDAGELRLTVTFKPGTDLNAAAVLTRDRVSLAEPLLPDAVRRTGVRVAQRPVYLLAVAVTCGDGRYDRTFLANYAALQVKDELFRVAGVAAAEPYGDPDAGPRVRVELDPVKLAAFGLTASDVAHALEQQNLQVGPGGRMGLTAAGRLTDPESLRDVVLKATAGGQMIRLGAVARFDLESAAHTATSVDGKPAAVLLVSRPLSADPRETAKAVRAKVAELAKSAPAGVEVRVVEGE